jgi:hypothetical protein
LKRAKALNGIIVSCAVLTDVPADALEWPLAASELIARLRAESAATVAALLVVVEVVPLVLVLFSAGTASANGVAPAVGSVTTTSDAALVLLAASALVADAAMGCVGVAVPPGVVTACATPDVCAAFELLCDVLAAVGPLTVPATKFVDCVPLGVPPDVLT